MAEGAIWDRIQDRISDDLLRTHLEKKRFDLLAGLKKRRKLGNADLGARCTLLPRYSLYRPPVESGKAD